MLLKEDTIRRSCYCHKQEATDFVYLGAFANARTYTFLYGFDYVHLNLDYFGPKGLSSA